MTTPRDQEGEMRSLLLDRDTADRLLTGQVEPDDAPPGFADVARLLRACSRVSPSDHARELATVAAMEEKIRSRLVAEPAGLVAEPAGVVAEPAGGSRLSAKRRASRSATPMRRLVRVKLTAVVVGGMVLGSTGLAFAGALPAPVQRIAHTMFAKVGLDVPEPDETGTGPKGTDGDGSSNDGGSEPSVSKGELISGLATTIGGTHGEKGQAVSEAASNGHSQAGTHGQSGEPHGQSGEPHGQSGEPHGQSGEPHGQSGEPHGQSGEPHGESAEPHGQSGEPHGQSDEPQGQSDEPHGESSEPHGQGEPHGQSGQPHGGSGEHPTQGRFG